MADLSFLKTLDKPLAIFGLGLSGRAVADACLQAGVAFHIWDDSDAKRKECAQYPFYDFSKDLSGYAALVPGPGVPPHHAIMQQARTQNIPVWSDIDLLLRSAPVARVIGITGTNGKSTTTALIGHILQAAGKNVATGGNIGKAACSLPSLGADGIYVLELSSFQLEITQDPVADIAVLLNITPDHLDWHGSMEHYIAAKERIFRQRSNHAPQTKIYGASMGKSKPSVPQWPEHGFLKGPHNAENIIASIETCRAVGLDDATILKHLVTFEGLPHRQKKIAAVGDVVFINDSKATNTDSAAKALATFEDIYWIVGGLPTDDKLNGLEQYFPKIRHAYLIGQAEEEFAGILDGHVTLTRCSTLDRAVEQAFMDARFAGGKAVILLSPACKSYDQYTGYEQRGDHFVSIVRELVNAGEKAA